jgi:hypothetical protein
MVWHTVKCLSAERHHHHRHTRLAAAQRCVRGSRTPGRAVLSFSLFAPGLSWRAPLHGPCTGAPAASAPRRTVCFRLASAVCATPCASTKGKSRMGLGSAAGVCANDAIAGSKQGVLHSTL